MRIPDERGKLGRYDSISEECQRRTNAQLVGLIVLGGDLGTGFSVSTIDHDLLRDLPQILRNVADNIDAQRKTNERS